MDILLGMNSFLAVTLFVTTLFIFHWSRSTTKSPDNMHGARDAKFQIRQSKAIPPPEEEACKS